MAGIIFPESPILKNFAGINIGESTFSGAKKGIYFLENSRNFLPAKISSLRYIKKSSKIHQRTTLRIETFRRGLPLLTRKRLAILNKYHQRSLINTSDQMRYLYDVDRRPFRKLPGNNEAIFRRRCSQLKST